jgi:hypothetical protein
MFDKNAAIEAYASAFNDTKRLETYCREVGFAGDVKLLAASINQIEDAIFEEIWQCSEVRPLTQDEMIEITRRYVKENEPWVNEMGVNGLLQRIAWLSWHEGCVKFPEPPPPKKARWEFWKS